MRIIARHLLREFAQTSAAVLAGLLVMWAAADLLLHVDELARDLGRGMREVRVRLLRAGGWTRMDDRPVC